MPILLSTKSVTFEYQSLQPQYLKYLESINVLAAL